MEITAVLGFAGIALALIAVPGPDWAYVLVSGARDHVVIPAVAGILAGYAIITGAVVAGLGPLLLAWPPALAAITVAGALYLLHLGLRTLRGAGQVPTAAQHDSGRRPRGHLARGMAVSGLNPKGILILLAILPQFARTTPGGWPLPTQLAVLGAVYILITAVVYLPLGYAADRVLGARPRLARLTTRIAGAAMLLVGAGLLLERIAGMPG
ncbi:LysE family translocator [Brachybacterium hainanense]|uniref:LysE family translocator n=1 Tax=Brachybacterium hainanense TaxID=1541174 RepID=A0ABV6RBF3_9MICO